MSRIIEFGDDELMFIPANPPVVPYRYDPRPSDRTVVADPKSLAIHLRNQFAYQQADETLVVNCHMNEIASAGEIKHALAELSESGRVVRRIVMYVHPERFRDGFLELEFRGYGRNEVFEKNLGPYAGQFALVKTRTPERKKESTKGSAGAA